MTISLAIVGDFDPGFLPHAATNSAIRHAASALGLRVEERWLATADIDPRTLSKRLADFPAILVAPGSPYKNMEGALAAIRYAREHGVPLLGTCGGFQHVILEYARHVLGFADAQHAEYDPYASRLFIARLACSLVGRSMTITLQPDSLVARVYGRTSVQEQYYCNFGVNPDHASRFRSGPLRLVGSDTEGEVRVIELSGHPFFVGTLFVPALSSTAESPHPLMMGLLRAGSNDPVA
jgi:CTP synthase (UTP-ammonia lyase)